MNTLEQKVLRTHQVVSGDRCGLSQARRNVGAREVSGSGLIDLRCGQGYVISSSGSAFLHGIKEQAAENQR